MSRPVTDIPYDSPYPNPGPNTDPSSGPTYNKSAKIPDVGATFRPSESNPTPPQAPYVAVPHDRLPGGAPASGSGVEPGYSHVRLPRN